MNPQDIIRRSHPRKLGAGGSKSARGPGLPKLAGYPPRFAAALAGAPHSARRSAPEPEAHSEFRHVTVELYGREGFNSIAVNGIWRFWRVKDGRLAFRRDVKVEGEDAEEEGCSDDTVAATTAKQAGSGQPRTASVRLFLFYSSQVDSWLISDSPDTSGTVTSDCGPVGNGEDLSNNWRIWDGERWSEDRNVHAEVALGSESVPNLKGLRIISLPGTKQRAASQDGRAPRVKSFEKPLDSARHCLTSRR